MPIGSLFKVSQKDRNTFCTRIIDASAPSTDYYFLVVLSTLIVAFGLLADNVILVIGGMLVTPMLSPILAISLGVVIREKRVLIRSIRIFSFSVLNALIISYIVGYFSYAQIAQSSIIWLLEPSLLTVLVALTAGVAASYTWVKPDLNATLPGIAVTVTIIPPLTAISLAAANGEWLIFKNVLSVFLLNVAGIIVSSLVVLALMKFYKAKKQAIEEIKEEEKIVLKETKKEGTIFRQ